MAGRTNAITASRSLGVVTPVFDDWTSLTVLLQKLDQEARAFPFLVTVMVVNDASVVPMQRLWESPPKYLGAVRLVSLRCNLGHQRAIAIGISALVRLQAFSMILVMDCDGEDAPEAIAEMLRVSESHPESIVVASRAKRSEGRVFRAMYSLYKLAFRCLTGKVIDFGNFCLLPAKAAERLVYVPDTWNHLAATVVKSRFPILRVPTPRADRYAGQSSMNLVTLVVHGLSAISVFSDAVLTRLFLFVGMTCTIAIFSGLTAIMLRLFTSLAIPGWATTAFGLSALLFLQSLTLLAVLLFATLANRSVMPFIPGLHSERFIAEITTLYSRSPNAEI